MNKAILIQSLIFVLVVSIAFAGVYAGEAGDASHHDTTEKVDGLYVSGSGDVSHVPGYSNSFGDAPHIESTAPNI